MRILRFSLFLFSCTATFTSALFSFLLAPTGDMQKSSLLWVAGEAIRRVGSMLRFFGEPDTGLLHSEDWEPHTPACAQSGVYCSVFPGKSGDALWTVVNRAGANFSSSTQQIIVEPQSTTSQFWDCYHGSELKLKPATPVPAPARPPKVTTLY